MNKILSQGVKVTRVSNAAAAAQTAINSSILSMDGFDGVIFIALLGTVTDASVVTLTAFNNSVSSTVSAVTTGVAASITAATSSNGALMVDVFQPSKEYVYANLTRTAQNAAVDGIIAIQYSARNKPTAQDLTTILASALGLGA